MLSVTPPSRPAHGFSYNGVNLGTDYVPPLVANPGTLSTVYQYNLDRQLELITRPDGLMIDPQYNATTGRLESVAVPEGYLQYGYDAATGNLSSIAHPDGVVLSYGWDGSLLTDVVWTGVVNGNLHRQYDNNFRVINESVNGETPLVFQYDSDDLLLGAGTLSIVRNSASGRVMSTTLGGVTDQRVPNSYGDIDGYSASYGASALFSVVLERDNAGRITKKTETTGGATHIYEYSYEGLGRLDKVKKDGVQTADYDYDANGNRVGGTYDDQDRLLTFGGKTYAYTPNGELLSKSDGGMPTSYTYDVLGALRQVVLPAGTVIDYVVDGQSRRVGKKVNGTLVKGWLYRNALQPVAELDGAGNVVSRFVYGLHVNVPEYMIKGGSTYRLIHDHLGSVRMVVDVGTGAVAQRIEYDEWGKPTLVSGSWDVQPFGFAGGLYDADTGLTRFGARDYDAEVGRWTSKDPIRFDGGDANLYGYSLPDPVNQMDPSGLVIPGGERLVQEHSERAAMWWDLTSTLFSLAASSYNSGHIFRAGLDAMSGGLLGIVGAVDVALSSPQAQISCVGAPLSINQMNRAILRGQAPRGIVRIDQGKVANELTHAHLEDGSALNIDGTWKHGFTEISSAVREWLEGNGWIVP